MDWEQKGGENCRVRTPVDFEEGENMDEVPKDGAVTPNAEEAQKNEEDKDDEMNKENEEPQQPNKENEEPKPAAAQKQDSEHLRAGEPENNKKQRVLKPADFD